MRFQGRRHRSILHKEFFTEDGDPYCIRRFGHDAFSLVIDIGANVGMFSMMARFLFPTSRVVAIEPDANTYDVLVDNIDGLNISTLKVGLGMGETVHLQPGRMSLSNVYRDGETEHTTDTEAPCGSLLNLFAYADIQAEESVFCKLDTEGAESCILDDTLSIDTLRTCQGIGMELHVNKMRQLSAYETRWRKALEKTHHVDIIPGGQRVSNLVAVRRDF